jgi:hypothetical protein
VLLDLGAAVAPALAPFAGCYPLRAEGVAALHAFAVLLLQARAIADVEAGAATREVGATKTAAAAALAVVGLEHGGTARLNGETGAIDGAKSLDASFATLVRGGSTTLFGASAALASAAAAEVTAAAESDAARTAGAVAAALAPLAPAPAIFHATLRGVGPLDATLAEGRMGLGAVVATLAEHLEHILANDGVLGAERRRLWAWRDVALAPTVPVVLQALLFAIPHSSALLGALEEMLAPPAAGAW